MLTTLITAVLCAPGTPAPAFGPCPAPVSFRYVFPAPAVSADDPDDLDELIDLAELAEEWGHTWPPPEWEGFDPWAPDGPWAEAWDDLDEPGTIWGPADRDLRPPLDVGALLNPNPSPPQAGATPARPPQSGATPTGPLQNGATNTRPQNGAFVVSPLHDGGPPSGIAFPGAGAVDRGQTAPGEVAVQLEEGGDGKPGSKSADERRPRVASEEPPGPRKKRDDREPRQEADRPVRDNEPGAIALKAATKWLGIPYVWGGGNAGGPSRGIGKGANRVGFDCSGLTLAAWAKAGVTLGHYTGTQIKQGKPVQTKDLLPGDLLFFGATKTDPSHVGLYAGDGDMIHAPRTGDVVKRVEVLTAPFWTKRFQGAVRPSAG
ncbi:C40 family peptidase [Herbidospora sp. RD11066]